MITFLLEKGLFNAEEVFNFLQRNLVFAPQIVSLTVQQLEQLGSAHQEAQWGFQPNKIYLFYLLDVALKNFNSTFSPLLETHPEIFQREFARISQINQPLYFRYLIKVFLGWDGLISFNFLKEVAKKFYNHS